jgi:hypothetical protein
MGGKAKILKTMGFAVLGAFMLVAWSTGSALAYGTIEGDCLACHSLGNVIVPDPGKQFAFPTPWHDFHGAIADCLLCHPEFPGSKPVPTSACLECHPGCSMMDPHTFDPWYNAHLPPGTPPCWECHGQIPPGPCPEPGVCGNNVIEWKIGETCDPPGSQCGRSPNWQCDDQCQCVRVSTCGDGKIDWKAGETCDPPGSQCGRSRNWVCTRDCDCINIKDLPPGEDCTPDPDDCEDGSIDPCGDPADECNCFDVAEGGAICISNFWCSQLPEGECPNGTIDCPPGEVCMTDTCCGVPECARNICEPGILPAMSSDAPTAAGL